MRLTVIFAIFAALLGFVAVYASLTLRGNGEMDGKGNISEKTQKSSSVRSGQKLKAFIFHKTPKSLPDFEFKDETGAVVKLSDWKGKIVLLNLWATWCAPCREEMPSLDGLKQHFTGKDFDVVAISMDRGGLGKPRTFYEEEKLEHLKLYIDKTAKLMFKLRAVGLPATLLISKDGLEIGRMPGPAEWDSNRAFEMINKALLP